MSPPTDKTPAAHTAARAVLTPVLEFLGRHAPFDRMAPAHLEFLAKRLKLGFYAKGEAITEPGSGLARTFYIIKQGRVRGEAASAPAILAGRTSEASRDSDSARGPHLGPIGEAASAPVLMAGRTSEASRDSDSARGPHLGPIGEAASAPGETAPGQGPSEEGAWELVAGECFPIGALLARRPVRTLHRAVEDTFCFELERDDFEKLLAQSPVFHDFCSRRLANLLDQALRGVQANLANEVSGDAALSASLASLVRRAPVTCAPDTPLRQALERMRAEHVGSIMITDAAQRPLGVFTLHDLLARVVVAEIGLDGPIAQVMTPDPIALSPRALVYEAALLMARQGFGHLCVVDDGRLIGVVSERDLFSLQRVGLVNLSCSITRAPDIGTLARLGQDVHSLIDQMLVQGASVQQLTQIIALLNDYITQRVIALCLAELGMPSVPFTWLSFGSEGRLEQTLKTDQDNGILFVPPRGKTAAAARAELLPFATRINQALAECGYPLCKGNIMASNPECCLSLAEWQTRFANWIENGAPEHLLKASIFFDFRALHGDATPVEELRERVLEQVAASPRFLHLMAQNALNNRPPLGLVRDFIVTGRDDAHPHAIDLKLRGTTPFVDGARLFALANRVGETNTLARFRAAAKTGILREEEAEAWCDAYAFLQLLRMRMHQRQEVAGAALDNYIDPDSLNELDRRILKEAFRQARKLQTRLALDYQL